VEPTTNSIVRSKKDDASLSMTECSKDATTSMLIVVGVHFLIYP
jgi:hypothetical protein